MENKNSGWCNLIGVICYLMGISLVTTLILIPIAIYCFIGGSRYFAWANVSDVQLASQKNSLRNWAIFVSIVGFPVGLVSLIPYFKVGNNPVVSNAETKEEPIIINEEKEMKKDVPEKKEESLKQQEKKSEELSNKEETIAKLKRFKDEGLITEQEYKKAIKEINGEF